MCVLDQVETVRLERSNPVPPPPAVTSAMIEVSVEAARGRQSGPPARRGARIQAHCPLASCSWAARFSPMPGAACVACKQG